MSMLKEEELKQYKEFKHQHEIDTNPSLFWCPKTDYGEYVCVVGVKPGKKHMATCKCGFSFCINCHEPWHKRGNWNKARDKGMVRFKKKPKVKHCPKCHTTIEKEDGWNHMTCHVCQFQFWWLWGKEYIDESHFNLIRGCAGYDSGGREYLIIAIFLPLILIFFPIVVGYEVGRPLCEKCPMICILIWFLLFWVFLAIGIASLVLLPFLYILLLIFYIRSLIKNWGFRQ